MFRLFTTHQHWTTRFLAEPTGLGVADIYGTEWLHPIREGRPQSQIGKKGNSNHRWIVGGKLGFVLNQIGLVTYRECAANLHDPHFQPLVARWNGRMIVLTDTRFYAHAGDAPNMKLCQRSTWPGRMLIETVLPILTRVCHFKYMAPGAWEYFRAHLAFTMAAFNLPIQWHGLNPDEQGFVHLSIALFSL